MTWTYLLLDLFALLGPLALSFDSKIQYFRKWKHVFLASVIIAVPFLIWDFYFTLNGVWGFNDDYITGIKLFNLPIEEILFFLVVPFSCTFIYECCKYYLRNWNGKYLDNFMKIVLGTYIALLLIINPTGLYTLINSIIGLGVLGYWMRIKRTQFIGITFLMSLIPFAIMNGILTGSSTASPIVWYNDFENTSMRIHTIPMEDIIYAMSLILSVIFVYEKILNRSTSSIKK